LKLETKLHLGRDRENSVRKCNSGKSSQVDLATERWV
jgi:hypothetical protein